MFLGRLGRGGLPGGEGFWISELAAQWGFLNGFEAAASLCGRLGHVLFECLEFREVCTTPGPSTGPLSSACQCSVGGGRRWCGIRVQIIARQHFKAFPSFFKAHSSPALRTTMKCLSLSKPFLSWVGIRSPLGSPTPHSDSEKVCSSSVWECVLWRYLTLLCQIFVHETNKSPIFPASFCLVNELPLPFHNIGKKQHYSFCEYLISPELCYANGGGIGFLYLQEMLLFTSWIIENLFFLPLSCQTCLWALWPALFLWFGKNWSPHQTRLFEWSTCTNCPSSHQTHPRQFLSELAFPPGVAAVQTIPCILSKVCL